MKARIGITAAPAIDELRPVERLSRWYVDAVERAGGMPVIVPTLLPHDAAEMLANLDGLVLSGGGDIGPQEYGEVPVPEVYGVDPARDAWELALVRAATATRGEDGGGIPLLGVCRGLQLVNVAAGGTLIQHLPPITDVLHRLRERDRETVHHVDVEPNSHLGRVLAMRRLGVNSIHHQAVGRIGAGFRPVAWAADGIVEAIEPTDGALILAVQWHPEALIDVEPHGRLFLWLTRNAARRRPGLDVPETFAGAAPRRTLAPTSPPKGMLAPTNAPAPGS
jgi:putative glutamine amidotransferase